MSKERTFEYPKDITWSQLGKSALFVWEVLLSHEFMAIDKVQELAKEHAGLTIGQVDGGLRQLRDTGWAEYDQCGGSGHKLKWKRRMERLLVPQKPSRSRRSPRKAAQLDSPDEATLGQLVQRMKQLQAEQANTVKLIEQRLKLFASI